MGISRAALPLLTAGVVGLAACHDHPHDEAGGHVHPPEPPTAQITVHENGYEAFVEHEYPAAGEPVRFITHISVVATGEPRREGPIALVLRGPSGEETRQVEPRVARDGIYLPTVTFPVAGDWTVTVEVPEEPSPATIALGTVRGWASAHDALHAPEPEEVDGVSFLKEQQWKLAMLARPAAKRSLVARRAFPGRVVAARGARVSVAAPLAGRLVVPPAASTLDVGSRVERGDLLATLEPMTIYAAEYLALEIRLAEAEAERARTAYALDLARSALARAERLRQASVNAARELEEARYRVEAARIAHDAASTNESHYRAAHDAATGTRSERSHPQSEARATSATRLELRAPISGTVVELGAEPGEHLTPAQRLFTILDPARVLVEAAVPEHEAGRVGASPTAYVEMSTPAGETTRLDLALRYAGLAVDPETRTVPFRFAPVGSPAETLRVGMLVRVLLRTAAAADVLAIPESALVDEDGHYVAFVQLAGETFEKRELTLGIRDRGFVEVRGGIAAGELVVTTDPWAIRLASLSTVIPAHGHAH